MFQQRITTAFPSLLVDHRCFADKSSDRVVLGMKVVEADMGAKARSEDPIIPVVSLAIILGALVIPVIA